MKPHIQSLGTRRNPATGKDEPVYRYIYDDLAAAEAYERTHPMVGPAPIDNRNTPGPAGGPPKKAVPRSSP